MSTRSLIGIYSDKGDGTWRATYHHWDGYPSGLGKTLWDIYHNFYPGALPAMMEFIVDAHPEGWSTLVGSDFTKRPTWLDVPDRMNMAKDELPPPRAYKYRGEGPNPADQDSDFGQEWAYVFDLSEYTMTILAWVGKGENLNYVHKATVPMDGTEPDWESYER